MTREERRLRYLHSLLARVAAGEVTALPVVEGALTLADVKDEVEQLRFRIEAGMAIPLPMIAVAIPGVDDGI